MHNKYSQCCQDEFVLSLIECGTFLDVGCYEPEKFNNTKRLEEHGWQGIAVDIKEFDWSGRDTLFIQADALTCDWGHILQGMPEVIDYLSLDIEGAGDRFKALVRICSRRQFRVLTVEHDIYVDGNDVLEAEPQRRFLRDLGYDLVCKNVRADTRPFEDWWVHPDVKGYERFRSEGMKGKDIMKL